MDVSNCTGDGTDYRTGSGTTKKWTPQKWTPQKWTPWKQLPDKSTQHCPDPTDPDKPWAISFRLKGKGKIIATGTYFKPMSSLTLVKSGGGYEIKAVEKQRPKPPKPPKPAVKATKPTKVTKTTKPAKAAQPAKTKSAA